MELIEKRKFEIHLSEDDIEKFVTPYENDDYKYREIIKETLKQHNIKTKEPFKYSLKMFSHTYSEENAVLIFEVDTIITKGN